MKKLTALFICLSAMFAFTSVSFAEAELNLPEGQFVSSEKGNIILADNMEKIAPTGNSREDDFNCWYDSVSDGLKREKRQIVLIKDGKNIIGFFQYYTNTDTFMMEEIQFKPEYQGKGVGTELMNKMIKYLKEKRIYIISVVFEECLKPFYDKFGFYNMLCGQMETYNED